MPASAHRVEPLTEPPDAVVAVPGSKSITNRALVCAALADGASTLRGIGLSDDTEAMLDAIARLGADVRVDRDAATALVVGTAGALRPGPIELDARLAGTTSRFVTALAASARAGTGSTAARRCAPARWRRCTTRWSRSARASSRTRPGPPAGGGRRPAASAAAWSPSRATCRASS